jgi:hypothetical protein
VEEEAQQREILPLEAPPLLAVDLAVVAVVIRQMLLIASLDRAHLDRDMLVAMALVAFLTTRLAVAAEVRVRLVRRGQMDHHQTAGEMVVLVSSLLLMAPQLIALVAGAGAATSQMDLLD